ncbi:class F sortase [Actinomadura opuntiae]|uniref:class F sortase n=1 Tax=Actinomadura sp. OS1-43 TaxID=604315 RepID=UPI00255B0961|nr:class F sortase [Actinomadura sp. OS1-43]
MARGDRQAVGLGLAAAACGIVAVTTAVMGHRGPAPQAPAAPRTWAPPQAQRAEQALALPAAPPMRIAIPALGVHAPVARAGLRPDGTLQPPRPPHQDRPAWYTGSVTPGEAGTAVIEGHLDSYAGPSVFFRLGRLRPGQDVRVRRSDGTTAVFTVDAVRRFAKDGFPTRAVYTDTPGPSLRLITCGGAFDTATRHYRDNTVAFAHLTAVARTPVSACGRAGSRTCR